MVTIGLIACFARPSTGQSVVRDSAGIRVVETSAPSTKAFGRIVVDPIPIVDIGAGDSAIDLGSVRGAARFHDGSVVVADGTHYLVNFFRPDGRLRFRIGEAGAAPGQFNYIAGVIHYAGDLVGVWDGAWSRLTVFDRNGRIVRWDRITPRPRSGTGLERIRPAFRLLGRFAAGNILAEVFLPLGHSQDGIWPDSGTLVVVSQNGNSRDVRRVWWRDVLTYSGAPSLIDADAPFGRRTSIAVGPTTWFLTAGAQFEVEERTLHDDVIMLLRVRRPRDVVDADTIAFFRSRRLASVAPTWDSTYARAFRWMRWPTTEPAYTALQRDPLGNIWARTFAMDGAPASWDVFDPRGRLTASVMVPPDLDVLEIGTDYLLAKFTRRDGTEEVREYRVRR